MPFSSTTSTSSKDWTFIYEKIITPAVEDPRFNFVCKRSKATRGNMLKDIVHELHESDIVIADMTDHNPNVCYELGIRHGLTVGTILLAQDRKFLNLFDLHNYASHVYNWKTLEGKRNMINNIRDLLMDFLNDPLKPDNPPQDFLKHKPTFAQSPAEIKGILEYDSNNKPRIVLSRRKLSGKLVVGLILLGNGETGLTMNELVQQISNNWKKVKPTDISPILSQNNEWFYNEGSRGNYIYRLSNNGRNELLNMVSLLKN
ncbi:MAG: hypothetical protein WD717_01250 [Nitrosarchaeum sp.]